MKQAPTALFTGYTSDGTNITIPIATIAGLDASEADASTGDAAKVLHGLNVTAANAIDGLATGDRPTNLTVSRPNSSISQSTGEGTQQINWTATVESSFGNVVELKPEA